MAEETSQRPQIVGDDSGPESPFPIWLDGPIVKGFGRGSKELGIPTANIPIDGEEIAGRRDFESGIYFGWAGLRAPDKVHATSSAAASKDTANGNVSTSEDSETCHSTETYPMVMSVGWNPFYKNEKRSVEIHLLHKFSCDFYGAHIRLLVLGFIRPERNYDSLEALVTDINTDIDVTRKSLDRKAWASFKNDDYLAGKD